MLSVSADQVWVRVDDCYRLTGDRFVGSLSALRAHLSEELGDVELDFSGSRREPVYLEHLCASVDVYSVIMNTPWGSYRWIQEPPAQRPSLRHRLVDLLNRTAP